MPSVPWQMNLGVASDRRLHMVGAVLAIVLGPTMQAVKQDVWRPFDLGVASIEMPRKVTGFHVGAFYPGVDGQCYASEDGTTGFFVIIGTNPPGERWDLNDVPSAFEAKRCRAVTTKSFSLKGYPAIDLFALAPAKVNTMIRARFAVVKGQMIGAIFVSPLDPFKRGERFIKSLQPYR